MDKYYIDMEVLFSLLWSDMEDKNYTSNVVTATYGLDGGDSMELLSKEVTETKENTHEYEKINMQTRYDFLMKLIDIASADTESIAFNTLMKYGVIKKLN